MKTKRRQELRQNELIHQLMELKEFAIRRWNYIAGVVVLVVLVFAIGWYWQYSRTRSRNEGLNALAKVRTDESLGSAQRLDRLRQIVADYSDRSVVLAALEATGAEAMRQYLLYGKSSFDPEQARRLLDTAEEMYGRIVREYTEPAEALARARLNLAAIAENRDDKEAARRQYRAILDTPQLKALTQYASEAETRDRTLDSRMVKMVILPPESRPTTTQAATRPAATRQAVPRPMATHPATTAPAERAP